MGVIEIDLSSDDDDGDIEIITPRKASTNRAAGIRTSGTKTRQRQPMLDEFYCSPETTSRTAPGRSASTPNASSLANGNKKKRVAARGRKNGDRTARIFPSNQANRRPMPRSDANTETRNNGASHCPSADAKSGKSPSKPICLD